jgi:hypothetical protein
MEHLGLDLCRSRSIVRFSRDADDGAWLLVMPFTEFMLQVPRYIFLALVGKRSELEDEATLSTANDERRTDTLIGLCQLVFGFFLQVIGVALLYFGTIPD